MSSKSSNNMDLVQRGTENKTSVKINLEPALAFAKKDFLPSDIPEKQAGFENTTEWTKPERATEMTQNSSLTTTVDLDLSGKVKIYLSIDRICVQIIFRFSICKLLLHD